LSHFSRGGFFVSANKWQQNGGGIFAVVTAAHFPREYRAELQNTDRTQPCKPLHLDRWFK
ncbi:TPA: hypothetical protein ACSP7Y_004576, partial [Serratia fonticola]